MPSHFRLPAASCWTVTSGCEGCQATCLHSGLHLVTYIVLNMQPCFTPPDSFFHLHLYRIKWCLPGKLFVQPVLVLWRIISVNSPHRMGPVQWLNASKYTDGREINKLCTAEREKLQRKQTFVTRMVERGKPCICCLPRQELNRDDDNHLVQ